MGQKLLMTEENVLVSGERSTNKEGTNRNQRCSGNRKEFSSSNLELGRRERTPRRRSEMIPHWM